MNRTLFPLVLIIISVVTFFMWINPHYASVKELRKELDESKDALAQVAELESVRASLVDKENTFKQEDLAKLQKLLPNNVDNIRLLLDIQSLASRYSTSAQDLSVSDQNQKTTSGQIGTSDKQYGQMVLSFSVKLSYENLILFLKDLEKSLRIVEVKSLAFAADSKGANTYKVSIGINTFWINSKSPTTITSSQ